MTWDGWNWFCHFIVEAKKLPIEPVLNPFSSFPHKGKGDRHSDPIFGCTMLMIGLFAFIYLVQLLAPIYK